MRFLTPWETTYSAELPYWQIRFWPRSKRAGRWKRASRPTYKEETHMAIVRDIMPAFELFQPATVDDTLRLLHEHRDHAWVMAGGLDTFDWLKDRIKRPKVVIDLSQVSELHGVREKDGGLEIGATT